MNRGRRLFRTLAGLLAAALALGISLVAVTTARVPAAAVCGGPSQNLTGRTGHGIATSGHIPVRKGTSKNCPVVTTVANSRTLLYDCWVLNNAGVYWTHVHIRGSQRSGWVYEGNLSNRMLIQTAPHAQCVQAAVRPAHPS